MLSLVEIGPQILEEKIFEGFLPYIWAWWPSLSCDLHFYKHIDSHFLKMLPTKFDFDWPSGPLLTLQ